MKKLYLLSGMAAVTALIAGAATVQSSAFFSHPVATDSGSARVPYYSPAAATYNTIADGWTVINANGDNKQFEPTSESASPCKTALKIGWSARNVPQDDYIVAPAVSLTAGTEYKVGYSWKSSSYGEDATVYMSQSAEVEDIKASSVIHDFPTDKKTAYTQYWDIFTPTEDGDYHFVFYLHSKGNQGTVYFAELNIVENKFTPASVTGLKATAGANRELSCKVEWTLPTKDVFGEDIPEDKSVSAVKIYRDGAELITLEGAVSEFTDTEATGLTSGYHVYGVSVVAGGSESSLVQVGPTAYVGPLVPFTLPSDFTIGSSDDLSLWTTINDARQWTYDTSYPYGAKYQVSDNRDMDNWLITPPFNVEGAGYYRVAVTAFSINTDPSQFEICLLSSADVENAEKIVLLDNWSLGQAYANSSSVKPVVSLDFKLDATGTYYLGIHNKTKSDKSNYATYYISRAVIEKTSFVPAAVSNLTAVAAADYANAIEVSWENPSTSLSGDAISDADYQVEIYLNDDETPAATVDGGLTSATVSVETPGVYTVTVKTVATDEDHGTAPNAPSVTTGWVGSHEVPVPYSTTFEEKDPTVAIWEIFDGNNDGMKFSHYVSSYSHYMELYPGAKEFKDYLLSPHMVLAPGFYKATVEQNGSSSYEAHPVLGVIKAGTFDIDNIVMETSTEITLKSYSLTSDLIFEIKEQGSYQILYGLDQTFASNYSSLRLNSLTVIGTELLPGDVTDLQAVISGDNNDSVELTWVNPTMAFNSEIPMTEIEKVVILRDGEAIETITEGMTPGEPASYVDTAVPGGVHTYTVMVTSADDKSHDGQFPSVTTDWVGGGQSAPVDLIASHGRFPAWSFIDVDGNHDKEDMYTWKYSQQKYWIEGVNFENDDYLVSSPIAIKESEIYQISYFMSAPMGDNPEAIDLAVKMGAHADDATEYGTVHTINLPASRGFKYYSFYVAVKNSDENEVQPASDPALFDEAGEPAGPSASELYDMAAKLPAEGDYRVALHTTAKGGIDLTEFHFTKVADKDGFVAIEEVESNAAVTFDGSAIRFGGIADVTVYDLLGSVVARAAEAEGEFAVNALAPGCYIVSVVDANGGKHILKIVVK